jgi:hypothetical protein
MSYLTTAVVLVGRVICTACILFATNPSFAADETVERCGLGPSPDSPDFFSYNEERERIRTRLGYEPVCDQYVRTLPPPYSLEPLEGVVGKLPFRPIPLNGTPFAAYHLLGARPDVIMDNRGARALRRYFAGPSGEFLELFEWDQSLGGSSYVLDPKRQSERVKGLPALLTIVQSKSGKALSLLSWEENMRHIELSINRNVRLDGYAQFMRLAESMPAPTPARPDAPIPKVVLPPPFGPGAEFPTELPE